MENQNKNGGLYVLIALLCLLVLGLGGYIVYDKTNNNVTKPCKDIPTEASKTTDSDQTNNNNNTNTDTAKTYKIDKIKIVQDSYNDNDTNAEKAQKIAKEVMNAVNSNDYYYLAKMVGNDADYFVKYGIYNYNVNISDYEELDGEYIFKESYESHLPIEEALEKMLIIKFEDGGRVVIDPNCTGV